MQLKYQYLNSLVSFEEVEEKTGYQPSIGTRIPGCPMHISAVERLFGLKDLEHCLRSYLHDLSFPGREGRKHRVKKRKLPQLHNPQVLKILSSIITYCILGPLKTYKTKFKLFLVQIDFFQTLNIIVPDP